MVISFAIFGRELFSIQILRDESLTQLALGLITERAEDEDPDEESEELPYGFSPGTHH